MNQLCGIEAVVVYAEVRHKDGRQPISHHKLTVSYPVHPAVPSEASAARNTDVQFDDDDAVGPELPPKLDLTQLVTADHQATVI